MRCEGLGEVKYVVWLLELTLPCLEDQGIDPLEKQLVEKTYPGFLLGNSKVVGVSLFMKTSIMVALLALKQWISLDRKFLVFTLPLVTSRN